MAVQKHNLNVELSREVSKHCKHAISIKQCYNNVFNVSTFYTDEFHSGKWKVAYGYYPSNIHGLYAKHCFIIDENNDVIDPTIMLQEWREFEWDITYVSHTIFDDYTAYLDALESEDRQPALYKYLYKTELNEMIPWAKENGIVLMG